MRNRYDHRERMIAETNAWLNWALQTDHPLPRIPRRRVDEGGFSAMLRVPAARAAFDRWWSKTLDALERIK